MLPTQRFHELHGNGKSPLLELKRFIREHGRPSPGDLQRLTEELNLPAAAIRGLLTYYERLEPSPGIQVCGGTSCFLNGGIDVKRRLEESGRSTTPVHCLGYCDRSPAILEPAGAVLAPCGSLPVEAMVSGSTPHDPTSVRCVAPEPIVTRNLVEGDFTTIEAARARGVYLGLEQALCTDPRDLLESIEESGELGRGGAAFPTGRKWKACAKSAGSLRYVVANGDEGDPGSFIDRLLLERDPHSVLEGLAICAHAVGASHGIVFIRSEYPRALHVMEQAVRQASDAGILGPSVMGTGRGFDVTVFPGMGSYVCGEETALLNAIEGFRGEVRLRPPYPSDEGLHGRPTVVNNVETLVNIPWIVRRGPAAYSSLGTPACSGTKALCLNRGFERPGVVEVEIGIPLRRVIDELGGGGRGGAELGAVVLGGPMGSILSPPEWDVPVCYSAMAARGVRLGHGGIVAVPRTADPGALLRHLLEFTARESCGRCVPCALGSRRAMEAGRRLTVAGEHSAGRAEARRTLGELLDTMEAASLCAFGQLMPGPLRRIAARVGHGAGPDTWEAT